MDGGSRGRKSLLMVAVLLVLAGSGWLAFDRYIIYLPGLIQDFRDPIGPNRAVTWSAGPATADRRGDLPNIVLIMADDLGWNDISLHGGVADGSVPTPSIDRIAHEGVQLTRAYAASATCAPSRAALMTGRYPSRIGFEFTPMPSGMPMIVRRAQQHQPQEPPFLFHDRDREVPAFADMGLPASETTLPELLGRAGYHSILIGKWHLGASNGSDPISQGFDESLELAGLLYGPAGDEGLAEARQAFDPLDEVFWAIGRAAVREDAGERFAPDGYLTDYFSREAVRAIRANRNRPFFLYLAHWAPHTPLQATAEDYAALAHIEDHGLRVYAAMIRALDRGVGQVLDALDAQGLADNTIVIFTSDNGGAHYVGLPNINQPLRGWKATFFEGGVRVPTFIRWPAMITPGSTLTGLTQHIDLLPTLAAVADVTVPQDRVLDGHNLLPLLVDSSTSAPARKLYWRSGHYRAVIDGDWKLQVSERPDRTRLFNLASDPHERKDLAARQPDRVNALLALLETHAAEQAEPLWPSIVEMPVNVDTPLGHPPHEDDEHVYWPN